jgi:multiple sugar transport system permease protein
VFYVLLILFALFFLLPLVWMFITAIKPFQEWVTPNWIPKNPTLQNFKDIFGDPTLPVRRWFINSVGIAVAFTLLTLIIDALAGYAYARMQFPGRNLLFGLLLATLVMPGIMFLVPNFLTVARLNWLGTYQGVIAPGLAGVFGVFFLRQFFQGIPKELEEAALIDGAGVWTTFLRVVLPLARGALATLGVITFMASWNEFLWPLLILGNEREMLTLPVGLATLQGQFNFEYGKLMAGATVTTIPVLLIYLFLQRYIVQSVAMTGLKG